MLIPNMCAAQFAPLHLTHYKSQDNEAGLDFNVFIHLIEFGRRETIHNLSYSHKGLFKLYSKQ